MLNRRQLIRAAAANRAGALLISGEAGVGKTVLARAAFSRAESKVDVLWGSCLPLTSLAVPFLPLTTALRQWAADHAEPVPLLRPSGETGSSDGPFEFDCWLASLCGRRPVVLRVPIAAPRRRRPLGRHQCPGDPRRR